MSEIIVTSAAVQAMVRMGDLPRHGFEQYMTARPDGRYNLRVSENLRRKLDRILVAAGTGNHSDAILAIERLSGPACGATP
jgi:hypothetical protein